MNEPLNLHQLNEKIGEAEKAKDMEFLKKHLSEDLLFRRASGTIDNREEFLSGLESSALVYHEITTVVKDDNISISHDGFNAVVKVIVFVNMTKDGNAVKGCYKNIRFFKMENGNWILTNWYNEEVVKEAGNTN